MNNRIPFPFMILLLSLFQSACATPPQTTGTGMMPASPDLVVDTASTLSLDKVLERHAEERLFYASETHTRNADHQLQLQVLRLLPPGEIALGVEWFQQGTQAALDDYVAGRIDEAGMLERTQYFDRWGFDYRLYRPILNYAREHGIRIIALNANRELTNAIRESGIEGLSDELRQQLPSDYDFSDTEYDRQLREVFLHHPGGQGMFERFREVQLTWDETMADNVAHYLQENPESKMLVLAGRGHISGRHGIPNRVTRRNGIRGIVIASPVPDAPARTQADYLIMGQDQPLPPRGMLGTLLDLEEDDIRVSGFSPGSAAKAAGVRKDDVIVSVDTRKLINFADFKLLMLDKKPGDKVTLGVVRKGLFGNRKNLSFDFELKAPAGSYLPAHRK